MERSPLCILQVNTYDEWGGAESVARNLLAGYRQRGHDAYLAVGRRVGEDPETLLISHDAGRGPWYRFWKHLEGRLRWLDRYASGPQGRAKSGLRSFVGSLGEPARMVDTARGIESFRFPGTYRLLDLPPRPPDIVHTHNLHGGYFDLRALPWLSARTPLVMTLHDPWLASGHCSHSFDCERWLSGCGECPDLTIYPSVRRDATAANWERKRAIFERSRLFVATPSAWLLERMRRSVLAPAIVEGRVIPNGVDLTVFKPGDRGAVRAELGIPPGSRVLLFVASGVHDNPFKDFKTLMAAVEQVSESTDEEVVLVALGESGPTDRIAAPGVRYVPFEADPAQVAKYYQAADLYLHAAKAETFPTAVLEAMACGTPVIATAVGGTPEQVTSLRDVGATDRFPMSDASQATGVLIDAGDAEAMARSIVTLLGRSDLLRRLSDNARREACLRFDLQGQCEAYLTWYEEILERPDAP